MSEDGVGGGVKDTEYIILLNSNIGSDKIVAVNTVYHTSVRWLWIDPVTLYTYNTRGKDYCKKVSNTFFIRRVSNPHVHTLVSTAV